MKIEELSIGNWVFDKNSQKSKKIVWLSDQYVGWDNGATKVNSSLDCVNPIPITEENILKYIDGLIAYKKQKEVFCYGCYFFKLQKQEYSKGSMIDKLIVWDDDYIISDCDRDKVCSVKYLEIKYIHQLQNFLTLIDAGF